MKTILVTGSAGFIGTNLCKRLLQHGNDVIAMDIKPSKYGTNLLHNVVEPLPKIKVDEIYNLAATPSPIKYVANQIDTSKTIILGAYNVLDLAKECGAKVLQASTCEVVDDISIFSDRACYRLSKKMAESIFLQYQNKCDIRIARIYNAYGPEMKLDDGRVIPEFIKAALLDEPITLLGNSSRSFCYIFDILEALTKLMDSQYNIPLNIFNEDAITIRSLAELIVAKTGSKSQVIISESREEECSQDLPMVNVAGEVLGWRPQIDFEEGIERTIKHFRGELLLCGKRG
jgi:UDP-glucuronate decarboxylase